MKTPFKAHFEQKVHLQQTSYNVFEARLSGIIEPAEAE
jgi:hypothetical protein